MSSRKGGLPQQAWSPEDIYRLKLPGAPCVSPVDLGVLVPVLTASERGNRTYQRLWYAGSDGSIRPYFRGIGEGRRSECLPRFAPTGVLMAFCSHTPTLCRLHTSDGPGRSVVVWEQANYEIVDFVWRDVETLALLTRRRFDGGGKPQVVDWLRYKHEGAATTDDQDCQLWDVKLGAGSTILFGSLGKVDHLVRHEAWIYFTSTAIHSDSVTPSTRICRHVSGADSIDILSDSSRVVEGLAVGCGKIYVASTGEAVGVPAPPNLWSLGSDGSWSRELGDVDLQLGNLTIGELRSSSGVRPLVVRDGKLFFTATIAGDVALMWADPNDNHLMRLTPKGHSVDGFDVGGDVIVVAMESASQPMELFRAHVDYANGKITDWSQMSRLNTTLVRRRKTAGSHVVEVVTKDGLPMHGIVYEGDLVTPTPVITRIHGGPHLSWGSSFDLESQIYVGAGYRILLPNLRGSSGFGERYWKAVVGEWGRRDFVDLLDFIDADVGPKDGPHYVMGGSYGGFLTNWTIANDDRFRAAVSERSISNFVSKIGTSDNGYVTNVAEMGGLDILDNGSDELWRRSPLHWVHDINTPVLFIHGESDQRCPIEQSEQLFVALRRLGREAVLARFPGEGHGLPKSGTPRHRVQRLDMILEWLRVHP